MFTIFIPGIPKAQPRPRAYIQRGTGSGINPFKGLKAFKGFKQFTNGQPQIRMYNPDTTDEWKSNINEHTAKYKDHFEDGALIDLSLLFYMPRPKGHFKKAGELKANAPKWHSCKPDTDNLAKPVLDEMTVVGIWHDDSSVVRLTITKAYAPSDKTGCLVSAKVFEE